MKLNRTYLFIFASCVALLIVLGIQINWTLQTAQVKEELFNEKADMVLSRTTEAIYSDSLLRRHMESGLSKDEVAKIDSMLNFYMKFYNVHIGYYFEVKPGETKSESKSTLINSPYTRQGDSYTQCLTEDSGETVSELKLVFPEKEEFILEEMGIPFITSVILILIVGVIFWRTSVSLMREKELSEQTTDFLNNMTHEFKTPLTNIALAGKMMLKENNVHQEDRIKHYSGIILEENKKLSRQVEEVLSMTALERGEIPLHKTELDMHLIIEACVKCIRVQVDDKHGSLKLELEAKQSVVLADQTHLSNALCNLIDNAIKYSPEKPTICIRSYNSDGMLHIEVSDSGTGIEAQYHEKIFDKFFRVPTGNVHDVKGFGLGLAYIKKIAELHLGNVQLRSEKGKGSTFIFALTHA